MKAMILAAGLGTRMAHLTKNQPKALLTIGKQTLIEKNITNLAKQGINEIIINVCYLKEVIQNHLGNGEKYGVNIKYSIEDSLLGTGGGIYNALPLIGDEPFIILGADIWTDYPFQQLKKPINKLAHLVLVDNPPFHPKGDFSLYKNHVSSCGNKKLNFSGFGVYSPKLFEHCSPGTFQIGPILHNATIEGNVTGEFYSGAWYNLGTPQMYNALGKRLYRMQH